MGSYFQKVFVCSFFKHKELLNAPLCSLSEILNYKNPSVLERFKRYHPDRSGKAEQLFEDLLYFFWGTKKHHEDKEKDPNNLNLNFSYVMDTDMEELDLMWHVFLLYTRDYNDFCQKYFGEFLHHQPDLVPEFEEKSFDFKGNLEKFLNYNFDLFGEEVMGRWFAASL